MTKAFDAAVTLLARREHGAAELANKLIKKNYAVDEVHTAIAACQNLALQSDQRFVEMLLRVRVQQGYGSERIRYEIQQKKVAFEVYEQALESNPVDWVTCAKQVLKKKYKVSKDLSWQDQQKQKQFLLYRGFSMPIIAQVFRNKEEEEAM